MIETEDVMCTGGIRVTTVSDENGDGNGETGREPRETK